MIAVSKVSKGCCQNCVDRKVGCHDSCEKYLKFKKDLEKQKQVIKYESLDTDIGWGYIPRRRKGYKHR